MGTPTISSIDIKIADELADHGELLKILFTETGNVGLRLVEQFGDDQRDPIKMPRARRAAIIVAGAADMDFGGKTLGIDFRRIGCPDQIDTDRSKFFKVRLQRARIGSKVFVRAKLRRIDKDRYDHGIALSLCLLDQGEMTGMERAHGRHQRDPLACYFQRTDMLSQFIQLIDGLHDLLPCLWRASGYARAC